MPGRSETSRTVQTLIALASLVVIIAGMRAASDLLVPFLLAAFLAVISLPPLVSLKKRGTPNWLSMLLVASAFVLISLVVVVMVRSSATGLASKLGEYQHKIRVQVEKVQSIDFKQWFDSLRNDDKDPQDEDVEGEKPEAEPVDKPVDKSVEEVATPDVQSEEAEDQNPPVEETPSEESGSLPNSVIDQRLDKGLAALPMNEPKGFDFFNTDNLFRLFTGTVAGMTGLLSNVFLIVLTVIFILLEAASIPAKLNAMPGGSTLSVDNMAKIIDNVNRYMAIKTMTSLATAVMVGVMLSVLGVPFATFWALLAFFLNFIPNIGSILAAVPAVVVAWLDVGTGPATAAAVGYVIINVVIGNVVEPRVMGKGLGLSTLVVFMSLVFWGWVLGPVGMLLSVPLTMTAKIALESNPETRWIGVLLGPGPPTEKPPGKRKRIA